MKPFSHIDYKYLGLEIGLCIEPGFLRTLLEYTKYALMFVSYLMGSGALISRLRDLRGASQKKGGDFVVLNTELSTNAVLNI